MFNWIIFLVLLFISVCDHCITLPIFAFYFNYRCVNLYHNLSKVHSDSHIHNRSNFLNLAIVLWSLSPLFQAPYIVLAFIWYLNSLTIPHLPLFDSIIQLFACIYLYRSVLWSIWPGNCIIYQFVSKLSAILNLTHYLIFPAHLECSSAFGRANSPQF